MTVTFMPCWQSRRIVIVFISNVVLLAPTFGTMILNNCVALTHLFGGGGTEKQVPTGMSLIIPSAAVAWGVEKGA